MKVIPIFTEKTIALAKEGKYTFLVAKRLTKSQIKKIIEETFGVRVKAVKTMTKRITKPTLSRFKKKTDLLKRVIVLLKDKDKIDIFSEVK